MVCSMLHRSAIPLHPDYSSFINNNIRAIANYFMDYFLYFGL